MFSIKDVKCPVDVVTFTEEILMENLFCSGKIVVQCPLFTHQRLFMFLQNIYDEAFLGKLLMEKYN